MLSYLRGLYHGSQPPRILITASTSSATLSKSGLGPKFSITLSATVEASSPITILPDDTLLDPSCLALFKQGLTFTNIATGEIVPRCSMYICAGDFPPPLTPNRTIEIPPQDNAGSSYEVSHTFKPPEPPFLFIRQTTVGDQWIEHEPEVRQYDLHGQGLEIGQVYEIGLGEDLVKVPWWRWGSKWEVFSFPYYPRSRYSGRGMPELRMVLVNRARFTVVE
ncbi:uncharacterized protein RCC_03861 [Ramularia collo-cygni]|uniref:Uncharacterized protein n=1 Tax=Ramularia collo-cygni TaxID=112498 RepID=A0A2D3VC05_9PEZI|nr:uncharacterized protein RCC_03861 [Ramularia collo-cygni]CZT18023.1 uncharacterized protein RCC_03861 [Ramularia collo-cygni]